MPDSIFHESMRQGIIIIIIIIIICSLSVSFLSFLIKVVYIVFTLLASLSVRRRFVKNRNIKSFKMSRR